MTHSNEIEHYGVLGMKWGVRKNDRKQSGSRRLKAGGPVDAKNLKKQSFFKKIHSMGADRLKNAKTANFSRWGTAPSMNVLYITGLSGSGKSTVAQFLADDSTSVIHLDLYFSGEPGKESIDSEHRSKEFDAFLASQGIRSPNMVSPDEWASDRTFEKFEEAVEVFGTMQYKKGRRVIAEGIQILDDGLRMDKAFYNKKPLILLSTSIDEAIELAAERDGVKLSDRDLIESRRNWYKSMQTLIKGMEKSSGAKENDAFVEEWLNKHGGDKI